MRWWQRGRSTAAATHTDAQMQSTCSKGQQAEDQALAYLQAQGLRLLARNYRTPGRGGGEIDLILQAADGTVVFVEVRSRSHTGFGGAGGSIGLPSVSGSSMPRSAGCRRRAVQQPAALMWC